MRASAGIAIDTYQVPLAKANRAVADGEEEGFVKVHVPQGQRSDPRRDDRRRATPGEMISEITLAMAAGVGLGALRERDPSLPDAGRGDQGGRRRLHADASHADRGARAADF